MAVIAGDIPSCAELIKELEREGFEVEVFGDAAGFYRRALARAFNILVVDIDLPGENGLGIVAHMRQANRNMRIVLLAGSGTRDDKLVALRAGADAYFPGPLDMELLLAGLQALVRHMAADDLPVPKPVAKPFSPGATITGWRLAPDGWSVITPTGQLLALTRPERAVMLLLDEHRGHPVERDQLIAALTPDVEAFDPHRLDALIHRIRRKAAAIAPAAVSLPLLSVRGTGYVLGV